MLVQVCSTVSKLQKANILLSFVYKIFRRRTRKKLFSLHRFRISVLKPVHIIEFLFCRFFDPTYLVFHDAKE